MERREHTVADKINPATKPVGKSDGIKQGSANSTLSTPNFDMTNGNKNWSTGSEGGKIFSKK